MSLSLLVNFEFKNFEASELLNSKFARKETSIQASESLDVGHAAAGCPT